MRDRYGSSDIITSGVDFMMTKKSPCRNEMRDMEESDFLASSMPNSGMPSGSSPIMFQHYQALAGYPMWYKSLLHCSPGIKFGIIIISAGYVT